MNASGASGGETSSFEFFVVFNGVCVDVDRHEMYRKNGARTEKRKTLVFVFRRVHQHSLPSLVSINFCFRHFWEILECLFYNIFILNDLVLTSCSHALRKWDGILICRNKILIAYRGSESECE